ARVCQLHAHLLLNQFCCIDAALPEIYTLSLHDALPISELQDRIKTLLANGYIKNPTVRIEIEQYKSQYVIVGGEVRAPGKIPMTDRKSTRLNSSHRTISYAVFCLKKKKRKSTPPRVASR